MSERDIVPELPEFPSPGPGGLTAHLAGRLAALAAVCGPRRRLLLGVSGGVDSMLMLTLVHAAVAGRMPLRVVHVHHGLQAQADAWAGQVQAYCAQLDVPCAVVPVDVDRTQPSREAAARAARHAAFARELQPGDALLLAHHADDQAETLLLRLLRGSGAGGLAAMREWRALPSPSDAFLWRPLLAVRRTDIEAEARRRALVWVEDASNADRLHDRNFLRHDVLPLLAGRWPAVAGTLAATARRLADTDALLNGFLDAGLAPLLLPGSVDAGGRLQLDAALLRTQAAELRLALLRRWLARIGAPLFSEAWLRELDALAASRVDAEGELRVGGWELHRFRDRLTAFPALSPAEAGRELPWNGRDALDLGTGHGVLLPVAAGLPLTLPAGAQLSVRFRAGGERLLPAGGSGHRPLKKVLQDGDVPPWLRSRLPLLYVNGTLAAVGDLLADAAFAPGNGRTANLHLRWQRPG